MTPKQASTDEGERTIADRVAERAPEIENDELRHDVKELVKAFHHTRARVDELEAESDALRQDLVEVAKERDQLQQRVGGGCR